MAANFDSLIQMTSELDHNFSIIGLTETKFKVNKENICNFKIPGYVLYPNPAYLMLVELLSL
jgi:hypothetical protein